MQNAICRELIKLGFRVCFAMWSKERASFYVDRLKLGEQAAPLVQGRVGSFVYLHLVFELNIVRIYDLDTSLLLRKLALKGVNPYSVITQYN
jgi:hypothetical protein